MGNKIASVFTWFTAFPNYSCITLYKVNTTPKANHMWYTKASRKLIWLNIFEYQGLESCLSDLTRFDMCCEVRLLMDGGRRRSLPLSGHYQIWGSIQYLHQYSGIHLAMQCHSNSVHVCIAMTVQCKQCQSQSNASQVFQGGGEQAPSPLRVGTIIRVCPHIRW